MRGLPKAVAAACILFVGLSTCGAAWADNAGLRVQPPSARKIPDPNRTYEVTVSCTRPKGKAPLPLFGTGGFLWQTNTAATHLIAISDSNTNTFPAPAAAKAYVAVYAISGDDTNRQSYVNKACNTGFFLNIRKPLYLLTNALKADTNTLGAGLRAVEAGLALVSSSWPLFAGAPVPGAVNEKFSAIKNSSGPISDFVAAFNKGASLTEPFRLYEGTYLIDTDYSHVVVRVKPLFSIVGLKNQVYTAEYEDAVATVFKDKLTPALTSDAVGAPCRSIANQMRDQQGISSLDTAYGLLFLAHAAGYGAETMIRCLGPQYANQAVPFIKPEWESTQKFTLDDVATVLPAEIVTPPQPAFDATIRSRLADIMGAMRVYATIKGDPTDADKQELSGYLAQTLNINNKVDDLKLPIGVLAANDLGSASDAAATSQSPLKPVQNWQLMDQLKKRYTRFGCIAHDSDSLALFLAIPESAKGKDGKYQTADVLVLRLWVNSKQQISQLKIAFDGADIQAAAKANGNTCGPNVVFAG
jgi:hypothetical protein